jgi:hypothetical protein
LVGSHDRVRQVSEKPAFEVPEEEAAVGTAGDKPAGD